MQTFVLSVQLFPQKELVSFCLVVGLEFLRVTFFIFLSFIKVALHTRTCMLALLNT